MAIADKLTQLNNVKLAIKNALINKGIDMTGVAFTNYASKIDGVGDYTQSSVYSYSGSDKALGEISIPDSDYIVIQIGNYLTANFNWSFTSTGTYTNLIETEHQTTYNSRYFRTKLWVLKNTKDLKITFNKQANYCQIYKLGY